MCQGDNIQFCLMMFNLCILTFLIIKGGFGAEVAALIIAFGWLVNLTMLFARGSE